jgi:hypothetical protein
VALVVGMAAAFAGALTIPGIDTFFELELPSWWAITVAVVIALLADVALEAGWRAAGWWQRRSPSPADVR